MRWGLIPAWWEEDREGARRKQRQPHLFTAADGSPILGLAGLSDRWRDRKRGEVLSCTIIVDGRTRGWRNTTTACR